MPYYQRQATLDKSLEAYWRLYGDIEISICDDGSPDPVLAPGCIVYSLPKKDYPLNPCVPINIAVRQSTGDVVVITNPEILHETPVLFRMQRLLETDMDYVTASCWDRDRKDWLAGPRTQYGAKGREPVPPGGHFHFCAMMKRSLFEKAGGFDTDYRRGRGCDDNDWLWRLHSVGARFVHCDETVYHTKTADAWRGLKSNADLLRKKWGGVWQ